MSGGLATMRYGFHASSLPDHDLASLAGPLRELGYESVVVRARQSWITTDVAELSRLDSGLMSLSQSGLQCIIDADAKFSISPWDRDAPRLARHSESAARETMLRNWIELAGRVDCRLLTFSVGASDASGDTEAVLQQLAECVSRLVELASSNSVTIAITPHARSVIETASQFHRLRQWMPQAAASSPSLQWAADIGVMARRGELPLADRLRRELDYLACVYLSDLTTGNEGDVRFGTGDLAIRRIVEALEMEPFDGHLILRCEGHGDAGLAIAREAIQTARGY